ncbi:hypothetical protein CWS35_28985 [Bradyrhizobium sp. SK17]|nr:hypothetical protein CWS35_28985 [Bradyrhizobium sp. SK17]
MRLWNIAAACLLLATTAGLSGCMETAGPSFNGPSGKPVSTAKCYASSAGCLQQASQACAGPYQVLDSESHSGGLVADLMPGPVTWYTLTYQCGPSDGKMPTFAFRGQQFVDTPSVVVNTAPNPSPGLSPQITCQSRRVGGMVQTTC